MRSELSVLQERTGGHVERLGEVEQALVEQPSLAMFDIDQDVPGDTRAQGERLLGKSSLKPQSPDAGADFDPSPCPDLGPLRISLVRAGGHLSTNRASPADVCPTSDTFWRNRTRQGDRATRAGWSAVIGRGSLWKARYRRVRWPCG